MITSLALRIYFIAPKQPWNITGRLLLCCLVVGYISNAQAANGRRSVKPPGDRESQNMLEQSYSTTGKLYNTLSGDLITRESYLISRTTYRTEDSFGQEGIIRYVFKYSDGQSASVLLNFLVRCESYNGSDRSVRVWADDQEQALETTIKSRTQIPAGVTKDAYELFREVCRPQTESTPVAKPVSPPASNLRCCVRFYRSSGVYSARLPTLWPSRSL